jgi:hypothetical protein
MICTNEFENAINQQFILHCFIQSDCHCISTVLEPKESFNESTKSKKKGVQWRKKNSKEINSPLEANEMSLAIC